MERSATRSGIHAAIAVCGGFLFGLAACFAVAFFLIILGCPEPRGQVCHDAGDLAESISRVWYLFSVPVGTAAGIVAYRVARKGSLPLKRKIAKGLVARLLIYAAGAVVLLSSFLIAAIAGFITSARAGAKCPVESAYECSEASTTEIMLGILIVAIALAVATAAVVSTYRFTGSPIASVD